MRDTIRYKVYDIEDRLVLLTTVKEEVSRYLDNQYSTRGYYIFRDS